MRKTGQYITTTVKDEQVNAFVPFSLPPVPPLNMAPKLLSLLEDAKQSCKLLNLAADMVPDKNWFIYGFVRKEAVVSSQIEGTQATLLDVFQVEAELQEETPDIQEITNYIKALNYSLSELAKPRGLPLSLRLLKKSHFLLMQGVRGHNKSPGEFRKSQNWIGGSMPSKASFVPPPPNELEKCLDGFEKYLYKNDSIDPIIRIALLHLQFETIHPFLDGNGRVGRLLITLLFTEWKILDHPLLYLSLYFKSNRSEYYARLSAVRTEGDWEGWIEFFLHGVNETAKLTVLAAKSLFQIVKDSSQLVLNHPSSNIGAARLITLLPSKPIVSNADVVNLLETTKPTAQKTIDFLLELGILKEVSGRLRDKRYLFYRYVEKLIEGTELK